MKVPNVFGPIREDLHLSTGCRMIQLVMSAAEKRKLSPAEYLERERAAEGKSEYVDGEVYAMSGATLDHNRIAMNVGRELGTVFKDRPAWCSAPT